MTRVIHKFEVPWGGAHVLKLPVGARIVHFAIQHGRPTFWALVNPALGLGSGMFTVVGTGQPIDDGFQHVGTTMDGPFVWHLMECRP